jgi:hypothetical protein
LYLKLPPDRSRGFADSFFRHKLARHCGQHIIIFFKALQLFPAEFPLHRQ